MQQGLGRLQLQAALKSGNVDESRRYARNMTTARMSLADQIKLAKTLHSLKLTDEACDMLANVRNRASLTVLPDVVKAYATFGRKEIAVEIATELIRKTVPDATWEDGKLSNQELPPGYANAANSTRLAAFKVLVGNSTLQELKKEAQTQVASSPENEQAARHLANICAVIDDRQTEISLRRKFNQPDASKESSDPFADSSRSSKASKMTLPKLKEMLEKNPKSIHSVENGWLLETARQKPTETIDILMPYLSKSGYSEKYSSMVNYMPHTTTKEKVFVKTLLHEFGYQAFYRNGHPQFHQFLKEEWSDEFRQTMLKTWVSTLMEPDNGRKIGFLSFQTGDGKREFITPFLLRQFANSPDSIEKIKSAAMVVSKTSPDDRLCQDVLFFLDLQHQQWDSAKQRVRDLLKVIDANGRFTDFLSIAKACHEYPELRQETFALLKKGLSIRQTNPNTPLIQSVDSVQLYLVVCNELGETQEREEVLDLLYAQVEKRPEVPQDLNTPGRYRPHDWQNHCLSTARLLLKAGRIAQTLAIATNLRVHSQVNILDEGTSRDYYADETDKLVKEWITSERAIAVLLECRPVGT